MADPSFRENFSRTIDVKEEACQSDLPQAFLESEYAESERLRRTILDRRRWRDSRKNRRRQGLSDPRASALRLFLNKVEAVNERGVDDKECAGSDRVVDDYIACARQKKLAALFLNKVEAVNERGVDDKECAGSDRVVDDYIACARQKKLAALSAEKIQKEME